MADPLETGPPLSSDDTIWHPRPNVMGPACVATRRETFVLPERVLNTRFEDRIICHIIYIYNTFVHSLTQTTRLVPGLMKARLPKIEMFCDWLAVPVHCDWRTAQMVFQYCPVPSKTASSSILAYQFRPRKY